MRGVYVRQLFSDEVGVYCICDNYYVVFRHERFDTVVAHLQQCSSGAEKVDELFGTA